MADTIYKIRKASIDDAPALAALHVETFNETHGAYPGGPTLELRLYQWQNIFKNKDDSWFCLVIEDATNNLIGFTRGQPYNHNAFPDITGELNKIYLLRKYHRLGLGRQLLCRTADQFINRGIHSMLLFGDANNASNGFYEAMGAEKLFAKNGEFHGGYAWRDLQKLVHICSNNAR